MRLRFSGALLACVAAALAAAVVGCERAPDSSSAGHKASAGLSNDRKGPLATDAGARTPDSPAATSPATTDSAQDVAASPATAESQKIVAYYFHRTMRCPTCLSIEKQSQEAIELSYNGELSAGTLEWHAVNIEEAGNEHFGKDFELQSQSLVLVEVAGERVTRWKLLPKVWELVEDPYGFQEYVATEVGIFLGGG